MPDSKITALTSISTSTDPANDPLVIVDVSDTSMAATGTTKKVTLNQLLGASGTATLASATITGDLTVDTSTLKVDSANNRVGIGTASPLGPFHLVTTAAGFSEAGYFENSQAVGANVGPRVSLLGAGSVAMSLIQSGWNAAANTDAYLAFLTRGSGGVTERYRIASDGVATWSNVGGVAGTAMTLNSTGLGVGASPAQKLTVAGSAEITGGVVGQGALIGRDGSSGGGNYGSNTGNTSLNAPAGGSVRFNVNNGTFAGVFDANANLGIGVTPSAWGGTWKVIEFNNGHSFGSAGSQSAITQNAYNNGTNWIYKTSALASLYQANSGVHYWYNAPSGTAGNAITFTQAMTLDASGNLLVGTTGNGTSARTIISQASSSLPALYLSGGAGTTPLINFNGAGRMRSDGQYLVMETTNASGVIYVTANTNGVYLAVGGTSWTANSDERLKDIIEPISNAVAKVGSLRSVIGKFKNDETNTRRSFLIAQDVQAVLPEAVDASNPDRLGVAYTEVIPLLVAAIKELTARVQTLETR